MKERLWEYYLKEEKYIKPDEFSEDIDAFLLTADIFFKQESIVGNLSDLGGRYFGYKKSIWNPSTTVTKYLALIKPSELSVGLACIEETHYNRSRIAKNAKPMPEYWSGVVMLRSAGIFGLVRENILGTPRAFAFSVPNTSTIIKDRPFYMLGDELEIVEMAAKSPINKSPIFLEKLMPDFTEEMALVECDLFDKNCIKKTHPHVWHHLMEIENEIHGYVLWTLKPRR